MEDRYPQIYDTICQFLPKRPGNWEVPYDHRYSFYFSDDVVVVLKEGEPIGVFTLGQEILMHWCDVERLEVLEREL